MALFSKERKGKHSIKAPLDFYQECVSAFHETAAKLCGAPQRPIVVPELVPIGQNVALTLLQKPTYLSNCADNAELYYQLILYLCIHAGMAVATQWDLNPNDLHKNLGMIIDEPELIGEELIKEYFAKEMPDGKGTLLFAGIFAIWMKLHDPYWQLKDPREYTLLSLAAGYQLGVSMILEKYGY